MVSSCGCVPSLAPVTTLLCGGRGNDVPACRGLRWWVGFGTMLP